MAGGRFPNQAPDLFAVIYRTGGFDRFRWRYAGFYASQEEATQTAAEITRMGYKALVHDGRLLEAVGLPDTWEAPTQRGEPTPLAS